MCRVDHVESAVQQNASATEARIIEIKPDERKMTLSIRRIQDEAARAQDAQAREAEYREFKEFSSGGGGGKRQRERNVPTGPGGGGNSSGGGGGISGGGSSSGGGGVTLGDVLSEQFASLRGGSGKAGRKRKDADKYGESSDVDDEDEG